MTESTDLIGLRRSIAGLIATAAAEEQALLRGPAGLAGATGDGPDRWAILPIVTHNTEFRFEQVERLRAIATGVEPPRFAEVDHRSARAESDPDLAPLRASGHLQRLTA